MGQSSCQGLFGSEAGRSEVEGGGGGERRSYAENVREVEVR